MEENLMFFVGMYGDISQSIKKMGGIWKQAGLSFKPSISGRIVVDHLDHPHLADGELSLEYVIMIWIACQIYHLLTQSNTAE
mmetsp:Transcript_11322/g.16522  ORF Transcript_11322/g.16522 Transcript_11322/m.16522 type:complete len:82 (+) Transcript_11322:233-478(+)